MKLIFARASALLATLFFASAASGQEVPNDPPPDPPADGTNVPPAPPPPPPVEEVQPQGIVEQAHPGPVPPSTPHARLFGSLAAGYEYQALYGVTVNAVDVTGVLGADLGSWTVGAELEVAPGRTDGGLNTFTIAIGPAAEARIDRVRIGGGFRFGSFNVNRVTAGGSLESITAGLFVHLSVDLVRFDDEGHGALFIVGKGSIDSVQASLLGASLGLGVRF